MRVMWIIAIHRKAYPNYHFRAIASNRPQLLGLGLSADYSFAVRIHILSLTGWIDTQLHGDISFDCLHYRRAWPIPCDTRKG